MLLELKIKNFVLIEDLKIEFKKGLNILTGETGAGKSILIDALSGVLGEKMTTDSIRSGCERAILEGSFNISSLPQVKAILEDSGIDYDDDTLVLRRELYNTGKGRCFANATQIPIGKLNEISDYLVDIHGQNEHQSIIKIAMHRELLDSFAGLRDQVEKVREYHQKLNSLQDRINSYQIDEKEKARRIEYLQFAINEIESAKLVADEEQALENESARLSNAEKLFAEINTASGLMKEDGGIIQKLKKAEQSLSSISKYDPEISGVIEILHDALYPLEDAAVFLRDYEKNIDFSPQRINEVEERLSTISKLKKKYGGSIKEIADFAVRSGEELNAITSGEEEIGRLSEEYKKMLQETKKVAFDLSDKRKEAAKLLEEKVMSELKDLGMDGSVFRISIKRDISPDGQIEKDNKKYVLYPHGLDRIEFLLSANEGEDLRQLRKVASGGEMSRIMLALKKVILSADIVDSLVFDEVDAGIGGKTAEIVGKKLKTLSDKRQVLVITHLPQIAAMSDSHYTVTKQKTNDRNITVIKKLNRDEKIKEVARMLAGEKITDITLKHAEEMIARSQAN
ncbi:MAG: DNA repair protein RecN [Spirochaetes bacterium]|jgi:DNA repair protein RecN (Recombination protein N)|nr:DNA repair protein RecN [Spirochaetota bacterium]